MSLPHQLDSPLYRLLRSEDISGFNTQRPTSETIDLREALLEGASLAHAQISGAFFPVTLDPAEILMSVNFGTRLRCRSDR